MKYIGLFICGIVFLLGLAWLLEGNEFFLYQYFAPKRAAVDRNVFEQSKSYRDGMVKELQAMRFEYIKASSDTKPSLGSLIVDRAAGFDENALPSDLRDFIDGLKAKQEASGK